MTQRYFVLFFVLLVCLAPCGIAQELHVVGWNVESGENDEDVIARQLSELDRFHIYGLTEVHASNFSRYEEAIDGAFPADYEYVHTESGGGDRMMIVYDSDRLSLVGSPQELERHEGYTLNRRDNDSNLRHRSPFVVRFLDTETDVEFLFMLNHLARGDSNARLEQAKGLREWARDQLLPVVAVGDYNFDYKFTTGVGNQSFGRFMEDDIWVWVEPVELIDTQWTDRNGSDKYPDTILDFVFVSGAAQSWPAESSVIERSGDFPDDARTSDHRPVRATLTPGASGGQLREEIAGMRSDLEELERLLGALKDRLDAMEAQLPQ
jgi:endonuclease/exonuclease/phosphatase family metal-dependent hydrolase